jgi:predicted xylose isomerase-like sugar epimerase
MSIPAFRRSRMVSFRLSPGEYETFAKLCPELGVRSISDIARIALQHLAAARGGSDPLAFEVRDLRSQLKVMVDEVDRIADIVQTRTVSKAGLD